MNWKQFTIVEIAGALCRPSLDAVPSPAVAEQLANALRDLCRQPRSSAVDLKPVCDRLGISSRELPLGGRAGGREGLLVPLAGNRFAIAADPTPYGGWAVSQGGAVDSLKRHRSRFRIAHEIAHTFFFDRREGTEPARRVPGSASQERFCDLFANNLLIPVDAAAAAHVSPHEVLRLQDTYDVSLEVAARAAAAANPRTWIAIWYSDDTEILEPQWSSDGLFPSLGRLGGSNLRISHLANRRQVLATGPAA